GDAGLNAPTAVVIRVIPAEPHDVGLRQRSWANDTHLARQHIDKLRPLINTRGTKDFSDARGLTVDHGPELDDVERLPVFSDAFLKEQNRTPFTESDGHGDDDPRNTKKGQRDEGKDNIKSALER